MAKAYIYDLKGANLKKVPLRNPDQIDLPADVKAAAELGSLTFFIGNGVSRLYGVPSWDELWPLRFLLLKFTLGAIF